ncbi:interleukin-12 subunit beta [Gouania willdenowi]|nr:interleukin-12 subunit beta-like [Gouania willdenowi]
MCLLTVMIIWAVLGVSTSNSLHENIVTLMDNVVVLRVPQIKGSRVSVLLTCGQAYENAPVFWKKNGLKIEDPKQGNQIQVEVEEAQGGNFTCHQAPSGVYLNHTVVFVQLDSDTRPSILVESVPGEGYIHCSAPNYEGSFRCTWKRDQSRSKATVLLVKSDRNTEKIRCDLDADGSGILCHDENCSFKEEQQRVSLIVYIYNSYLLEGYTKTFYLREIAKPGKLPNLRISGNVSSWDYPALWSKPCTFFSLQFQVKVVQHGRSCNIDEHIVLSVTDKPQYEIPIKSRRYTFCVRAQDKFTEGPWSHWSHCKVNKSQVTC